MSVKGQAGSTPKATIEEEEERIRIITIFIAEGRHNGEIKKLIAAKFQIKPRSAERYMARARARLRQEIGKSKEDLRVDSFAYYQSVLRDPEATIFNKLKARQRIDKLLGVDVPQSHGTMEVVIPGTRIDEEKPKENRDVGSAIAKIRQIYGLRSVSPDSGDSPAEDSKSA